MTEQLGDSRSQASIGQNNEARLLCHGDANIEYASPALATLLGYQAQELVGTSLRALVHPDDSHVFEPKWSTLCAIPGSTTTIQCRARHRDDSWRWLEVSARNLLADPTTAAVTCNLRDISEQKCADGVRASLGAVAHDLNNVLSVVLTYTALVMEELAPNDPHRLDLDEVYQATKRAIALTRQLPALGKERVPESAVRAVGSLEHTPAARVSEITELAMRPAPHQCESGLDHADCDALGGENRVSQLRAANDRNQRGARCRRQATLLP